ncbi:hypothetical protein [Streptantibioticus ferralitis]|uniref:Transposase n=1 Tax=Streptantibioticus ferralitis TaxID=236510 RepID=A0ABT5YZ02_9ACTN|nr:hypothetical protein [Streptantibioticus ferralitis]MDF2256834.1 hypothetical protein [Streptantibioticus ferralitis]
MAWNYVAAHRILCGSDATGEERVRRCRPRRPSSIDLYLDYLQKRWDEGEHKAKLLHQELTGKGYRHTGSTSSPHANSRPWPTW